jgi:hypothetical protein
VLCVYVNVCVRMCACMCACGGLFVCADASCIEILTHTFTLSRTQEEAVVLRAKLANPSELTGRELVVGASYFVQIFGAFCLGEIIGRDLDIQGYPGFYN